MSGSPPLGDDEFSDRASEAANSGNGADPSGHKGNGHDPNADVDACQIRFTIFEAHGSRLSKEYKLAADGGVVTDSGTKFVTGDYRVVEYDAGNPRLALAEVGRVIDRLPPYTAIGLGTPKDGTVTGTITTKDKHAKGGKTAIPRSLSHFNWPCGFGLLLLDGDDIDGLQEILSGLYPPFADVALLVRPSASASVINPKTGKALKTSEHGYVLIDEPALSAKCLDALMHLAWCHGSGKSGGRLLLAKNGAVLVRGPVDDSVGSPERLSYEGEALVGKELDRLPRTSTVIGGSGVLAAADLIEFAKQHAPKAQYEARVSEAKNDPDFVEKRARAQAAYRDTHIKQAVARGIPRQNAAKDYDEAIAAGTRRSGKWTYVPLTAEHVLYWPDGRAFAMSDIQQNRAAYHGRQCCDPIEGTSYQSRNCAIIYTNGPQIEIYSRAHGDAFAYVAPLDDLTLSFAELLKRMGSSKNRKKNSGGDGPETFDDLPVDLKKLIASPPYPGENPDKTIGSVVFKLFIRGWTNEAIKELFEAHSDGIGAEFKDGKKDLHAEIEHLRFRFTESDEAKRTDIITEINSHHALVLAGNKTAIMKFESATLFRLLQVDSFKQWFGNELVQVGDKVVGAGKYWLGHSKRRQYEGIEFEPGGGRRGYYNLWQGFAVRAEQGDCSKFLAHIMDNIAQGDEATYLWIVGWWAQIFQQPALKMETALVLRGGFGTGKTKLGEVMGSLIPQHYRLVPSARYITGQFNSHMASLLVLHADEAFWAGDKKSEGTLKDLVSGKNHMLEYKGVDAIAIKNFIRLFVSGNPDWLIPAGFKDRRWAVFDVGEKHMQDHAYFAAIDHEMDNGGREALLHYLLNFDLSQVNLRVVPKTAALLDQQIESMNAEQAWWMDTLKDGMLPIPRGINEKNLCVREALHERYVEHAKKQGAAHRSSQTKLGIFLSKQLGDGLKTVRPCVGRERPWCYSLPTLAECRKRFAADLGRPIDWGDDWEKDLWRYWIWNIEKTV